MAAVPDGTAWPPSALIGGLIVLLTAVVNVVGPAAFRKIFKVKEPDQVARIALNNTKTIDRVLGKIQDDLGTRLANIEQAVNRVDKAVAVLTDRDSRAE